MTTPISEHPLTPSRPTPFQHWYIEGMRCAALLPVRWQGLQATPATVALLVAINLLLSLLMDRLYIDGAATFYWQAIASGWFGTALIAWASYLMRPQPAAESRPDAAPSAAHLLCMMLAQLQVLSLVIGLVFLLPVRTGWDLRQLFDTTGMQLLWLLPSAWTLLAQFTLLSRSGVKRPAARLGAALALLAATLLYYAAPPAEFWYPDEQAEKQTQRRQLTLTQELMEAQPLLLTQRLKEIAPQRPGVIDLYALTFAPYAEADVFQRESGMVANVMAQRFDATGRTLQLVNHIDTPAQWPWATPLNLQRTIRHLATIMDREEDVLFIHLTSHGARDGELAAGFWPLTIDSVRPAALKQWLDDAGIKYRVLSISACYSGSWIAPLTDDNTLVMTAADADHTSYGCGRRSDLTFFGRAMYDEQLRKHTLSFEEAHAAARNVIKTREEEAGKDDGYSNPQISIGSGAKNHLARLHERLHAPQ